MATTKTSVTEKQRSTWIAFNKTKSNVFRLNERELIIQYSKEILNKKINPKNHKEWEKAFNAVDKKIKK